jgi:thiazole synthase
MFSLGTLLLRSRLLLGTAQYPSPETMQEAIRASGTELVTVSIRRHTPEDRAGEAFWDLVKDSGAHVLPNTAGCHSAREAITTALMAREIFETPRIKLEVIGDDYTLQPDPLGLVEAARELVSQGFEVLPYSTEDLVLARHLVEAGCLAVMPWAAPIGSGQGIRNPAALRTLRERLPETPLIVDAGIGKPSEAARVMEMGFDAVLLNSAVALADDPARMAEAFRDAITAGRAGFEAGLMESRDMASPSTPTLGTPFWHQDESSK